jgi:hypothetical protein
MESLPIIEYFDSLEDIPSCLFTAAVLLMLSKLGLESVKEAFYGAFLLIVGANFLIRG